MSTTPLTQNAQIYCCINGMLKLMSTTPLTQNAQIYRCIDGTLKLMSDAHVDVKFFYTCFNNFICNLLKIIIVLHVCVASDTQKI